MFYELCPICELESTDKARLRIAKDPLWDQYTIYSCKTKVGNRSHYKLIFNEYNELALEAVLYEYNEYIIVVNIFFSSKTTYIGLSKGGEIYHNIGLPCYCRREDKIKNYLMLV